MTVTNNIQPIALEVLHVKTKIVACDGTRFDGAKNSSTHPLVYLNMGDEDHVTCLYCSRYFTISQSYPNQHANFKNKIKN